MNSILSGKLPWCALWIGLLVLSLSLPSAAQEEGPANDDALIADLAAGEPQPEAAESSTEPSGIDLLTLIGRGGKLMWPIGLMSLLVVTLAVERLVSFRRSRMVPRRLVKRLNQLVNEGSGAIDAEAALAACKANPSAAANVVSAMLMRSGRPLGEIEQTANEAAQREADLHAGPIRWLNLAAAATPLMGLLGTVWGMIVAFHNSANLTAERSRSEQLSEGIYTALVTTLAGLAVAIPAAILAQYLENRLGKLFHKIETLAFSLAPSLEHYTGKYRMDAEAKLQRINNSAPPPVASRPTQRSEDTEGRVRSSEPRARNR